MYDYSHFRIQNKSQNRCALEELYAEEMIYLLCARSCFVLYSDLIL